MPSNYEKYDYLTKQEKELSRLIEKNFVIGDFIVGVHPIYQGKAGRISIYIHPLRGILAFRIIESGNVEIFSQLDELMAWRKSIEEQLYHRLADSKQLIAYISEKKVLKIPFHLVLVFQEINAQAAQRYLGKDPSCYDHILFRGFTNAKTRNQSDVDDTSLRDYFSNSSLNVDEGFKEISEDDKAAIIDRLAPEYSIVLPDKLEIEVKPAESLKNDEVLDITGKEKAFATFSLDEEQVNIVNDIKPGHHLLLANAGAGKSVILLSKSYRIADLYPEKKVLLTCYNKNLAQAYEFRASVAGFQSENNLYIKTFHGLVRELAPDLYTRYARDEFSRAVEELRRRIERGNVRVRFKAIFIDEVQIFDPTWIDLCYSLLEEPKMENYFTIAGDLNQDVKSQCKNRKAVWQKARLIPYPKFKGRTRYIKKNYRNSKAISDYLNGMLKRMVDYDINPSSDPDYVLYGQTTKKGKPVQIINVHRNSVTETVLDIVEKLHKAEKIPYNEIAILFPAGSYRPRKYYILGWLEKYLGQKGIPFDIIYGEQKNCGYGENEGVILSTIESSLGLDFKAVILCGLFPMDYACTTGTNHNEVTWTIISKDSEVKEEFSELVKKVYTGCSRARDLLFIINDLNTNSPFNDLINDDNGRKPDGKL